MMDLWYVLVVVAVVAVALFLFRSRRTGGGPAATGRGSEDFVQGREDARVTGMSQEDRDWEAASLQRDATRRGPSGPG